MLLNGESIKNNVAFNMQFDISSVFPEQKDSVSLSDAFKLIGKEALLSEQIKPRDEVPVTDNPIVRDKMSELTEKIGLSEMSDKFWERSGSYVEDGYKETQRSCVFENGKYVEFSNSDIIEKIKEFGRELYSEGFKPDEDGFAAPSIDTNIRELFQNNGISEIGYNVLSDARVVVEAGYSASLDNSDVDAPPSVEDTIKLENQADIADNVTASVTNGIGFIWSFSPENGVSSETVKKLIEIDPSTKTFSDPQFLSIVSDYSKDKVSYGSFEAEYKLYEKLMDVTNKDRVNSGLEPLPVLSRDDVKTSGLSNDEIERKAITTSEEIQDKSSTVENFESPFNKYDSPGFWGAKSVEEVEAFSITRTESITKRDGSTQDVTMNLAQSLRTIGRELVYKDRISTGGELSSVPDVKARIDETLGKFGLDHPSQSCYARIATQVDRSYNDTLSKSVQIGNHFVSFDRCKVVDSLSEFGTKLGASGLLEKFDKSSFVSSPVGEGIIREIFIKNGISYYGDKTIDRAATLIERGFADGVDKEPLSPQEVDSILPMALKTEYGVDVEITKALLSGELDERLEAIADAYKLDLDNDTKFRADITLYRNLIDYQNENLETDNDRVEYTPNYKIDTSGITLDSFAEKGSYGENVSSAQMYSTDKDKDLSRFVDSLPGDYRILGKFIVDLCNCKDVSDVGKSVCHLFVGIAIRDLAPINNLYKTIDAFRGTTDKESSLAYNRFQLPMQEWDKRFTVESRSFSESCSVLSGQRESNISNEELQSRKMAAYEGAESALLGYSDEVKEKVLDGLGISTPDNSDLVEKHSIAQDGVAEDKIKGVDIEPLEGRDNNTSIESNEQREGLVEARETDATNIQEGQDKVESSGNAFNPDVEVGETKSIDMEHKQMGPSDVDNTSKEKAVESNSSEYSDKKEGQTDLSETDKREQVETKDIFSNEQPKEELVDKDNAGNRDDSIENEDVKIIEDADSERYDILSDESQENNKAEDVVSEEPSNYISNKLEEQDDDAAAIEDDTNDNISKNETPSSVGESLTEEKDSHDKQGNDSVADDAISRDLPDNDVEADDGRLDLSGDDNIDRQNNDSDDEFDFSSLFSGLENQDVSMTVDLISNLLNAESATDVGASFGHFITDVFESRIAEPFDTLDRIFDTGIGEKIHDFFDIVNEFFDSDQFVDMFKGFSDGLSESVSESLSDFLDNIYQNIESSAVENVVDPTTGEPPKGFDSSESANKAIETINESVGDYLLDKLDDFEFTPNETTLYDSNVEIDKLPDNMEVPAESIEHTDGIAEQITNSVESGQHNLDFDNEQNFENCVDNNPIDNPDASQQISAEDVGMDDDTLEELIEVIAAL